jgi:hypothetical protein
LNAVSGGVADRGDDCIQVTTRVGVGALAMFGIGFHVLAIGGFSVYRIPNILGLLGDRRHRQYS